MLFFVTITNSNIKLKTILKTGTFVPETGLSQPEGFSTATTFFEPTTGFEPVTSSLPRTRSTN